MPNVHAYFVFDNKFYLNVSLKKSFFDFHNGFFNDYLLNLKKLSKMTRKRKKYDFVESRFNISSSFRK